MKTKLGDVADDGNHMRKLFAACLMTHTGDKMLHVLFLGNAKTAASPIHTQRHIAA